MHIISLKNTPGFFDARWDCSRASYVSTVMIFFLSYQSFGENHFVHTGNHNLVISLGTAHKNVFIEILEPLLHQGISKKQESLAILATSICLSLIFAVAFSFISCCLLPLYHEDIFEKKNVHECLQCPPH